MLALPEGTRIQVLAPVVRGRKGEHAKGEAGGGLHAVGEAACDIAAEDQAVHHDLQGVLAVLVQLDLLGEVVEGAVHPHPDIAG